jgi:hypothetical protein
MTDKLEEEEDRRVLADTYNRFEYNEGWDTRRKPSGLLVVTEIIPEDDEDCDCDDCNEDDDGDWGFYL